MARQRDIDRVVADMLSGLDGRTDHLTRAVLASRVAEAAERLARVEVMSAREFDDATWADVGRAFGVSTQTAHERFRSGPDGLHSRFFQRQENSEGGSRDSGTAAVLGSKAPKSSAARRGSAARS
jgi:hypothetical protein